MAMLKKGPNPKMTKFEVQSIETVEIDEAKHTPTACSLSVIPALMSPSKRRPS